MVFFRRTALLVLVSFLACVEGVVAADAESDRSWTVPDSIAVRYFVTNHGSGPPGWLAAPGPKDVPVVVSPGGRHLFFVSFHGDLQRDEVVYELAVYAVDEIKRRLFRSGSSAQTPPPPVRRVTFRSRHSDEFDAAAILNPRWEDDHSILFVGVEGAGPHRVYRLRVDSGALEALTDDRHDVVADLASTFAFEARGKSIIFAAHVTEPWRPLDEYPMAVIRKDETSQLIEPERPKWNIHASHRGAVASLVGTLNGALHDCRISPDEKWAVLVFPPRDLPIPVSWLEYELQPKKGYRFLLVDLVRGITKPVFDAPAGTVTNAGRGRRKPFDAFWSADSRHVVLFNTALPLTDSAEERRRMSYIMDYVPDTGAWTILEPMASASGTRVHEAGWLREGRELLVTRRTKEGTPADGTVYQFDGERWLARTVPASKALPEHSAPKLPPGLLVTLHQDANEPPAIMASYNKRQLALTGPDPALQGIWRARAETVEWSERDGKTAKGLLMLPRHVPTSKPVPLVIQGFSYEPQAFRPDGVVFSGFAAQAFAGQGFAVLQLDLAYDDIGTTYRTPREAPARVERIDVAVEMLAARGLIDPTRVGLMGFSRSGYSVYYILTHPGRTKLAAAAVFDSITASYGEYVTGAGLGSTGFKGYENQYGTGTFWQNKEAWMDAPSFNVDRVVTPVLFSAGGNASWGLLETIGAFRYNRRPFEYLYFSAGSHQLQRPREREAAMQTTVDWMSFWIQGRSPARSPSDDRFERWSRIKSEWQKTQAEEAAARANAGERTHG